MDLVFAFIRQVITTYVGGGLLFIYFKLKKKKITYSEIVDGVDKDTGIRKYRYTSYYIGVFFIIIIILLLSVFW